MCLQRTRIKRICSTYVALKCYNTLARTPAKSIGIHKDGDLDSTTSFVAHFGAASNEDTPVLAVDVTTECQLTSFFQAAGYSTLKSEKDVILAHPANQTMTVPDGHDLMLDKLPKAINSIPLNKFKPSDENTLVDLMTAFMAPA